MLIPNHVRVTDRSVQQKINEYNSTYGSQPVPVSVTLYFFIFNPSIVNYSRKRDPCFIAAHL